MSKQALLWEFVKENGSDSFSLPFDEIAKICDMAIDHSFLNSKKELLAYGYQVQKISLKEQTVSFQKIKNISCQGEK